MNRAAIWENLSMIVNKGADQPAHPHSLISAFVIPFLASIISKLATREKFNFLASLCIWAGMFEHDLVGNPKTRFLTTRPNIQVELVAIP